MNMAFNKASSNIHLDRPGVRERVDALAEEMIERDDWPRERLLAHQQGRLRELVEHAVARSPYYREAIGRIGTGAIELQQLPILTKATLMSEFDRIVTDSRLRLGDLERHVAGDNAADTLFDEYRVIGTGGTTGQRGIMAYDCSAWEVALASIPRAMKMQGVFPDMRVLGIGAPTPLHATNRLFAELRAGRSDVPHVAVTTPLPEIVAALNEYQPEAIVTYPSLIRRLAEEQSEGRLAIMPTKFCSVAETLTDDVRAVAREVWGAPVLNLYGTTEAGLIGTECECVQGLHVLEDLVILEVVDADNRPVPPGVAGSKVLITNLFSRTVPLIRYELSDIVTVADGQCACGRTHLRVRSIQGRREDVLDFRSRNGGRVKVNAFLLGETLLHIPEVSQYQLNPHPDGLRAKLVLRANSGARQPILRAAYRALVEELDKVGAVVGALEVEAVDEIERTGTGAKAKIVAAA